MPVRPILHVLADLARSAMSRFMSRPVASLALSVWVCWGATAQAQSPGPASRPVDGERLSDWLLRQPTAPQAYPLGLMWLTPSERSDQTILEGELLHHLQHHPLILSCHYY